MSMTRAEQKAYQEWLDLCERIRNQTGNLVVNESAKEKKERKADLLLDPVRFCNYYFAHYLDSDFGWFHKKAMKAIAEDPNIFGVMEWPREHAKSVLLDIFMPMYLYAAGQMEGMVVASATESKAKGLLGDIQAEFESNLLWINDYGNLTSIGNWQDGHFTTTDGIGFWAFGRGQSPRGIRKAAKRPNYAVVDDIDDKVIVRNDQRVRDAVDWVLEDLYGALGIKGARLIIAGNRIHKKSILAHLVGDVEPDDPKRKGITHIKVYAVENKRHNKASFEHGRPAWKERYTLKQLREKMDKQGYRSARREFFHEHHEEGHIFRNEWVHWRRCLKPTNYDHLCVYCDPSFKDKQKNDYKAVVLLGKQGNRVDIIKAWVRQATVKSMVAVFYDLFDELENHTPYYMEANFLQDMLLDEFDNEATARGYHVPVRADKRKKPAKEDRIENLTPLFERGHIAFNELEKSSPDMQTLVQQFLGFPYSHDDGPDAVEGAVYMLQGRGRASRMKPRTGSYRKNRNR